MWARSWTIIHLISWIQVTSSDRKWRNKYIINPEIYLFLTNISIPMHHKSFLVYTSSAWYPSIRSAVSLVTASNSCYLHRSRKELFEKIVSIETFHCWFWPSWNIIKTDISKLLYHLYYTLWYLHITQVYVWRSNKVLGDSRMHRLGKKQSIL